jgi:3-oxoacyl-[acyl-carrier protein] reductase
VVLPSGHSLTLVVDYQLRGRVALVTAASRGIGRGIAEALAAEGVRLVIASRDQAAISRTADEIANAYQAEVVPVAADVSSADAAERLVSTAAERFGGLDILVNNSGGPPGGRFTDFDDAAWQSAFDLLLLSVVRMVRAALPYLRASGTGRIINVESSSVKEPIPGLILSNSLRAGVAGLAKTLADELAPDQITVNTVLPGQILTDRLRGGFVEPASRAGVDVDELARAEVAKVVPLGRVGEPADLANLVAFLCSELASYLTGLVVAVDGGRIRSIF